MLLICQIAKVDCELPGVFRANIEIERGCFDVCDLRPGKREIASILHAPDQTIIVESSQLRSEYRWIEKSRRNPEDSNDEVKKPEAVVYKVSLNKVDKPQKGKNGPLNP